MSGVVVDLTGSPPRTTSRMSAAATAGTAGGAQALQCKQVLRVLASKTRVPGSLRLDGTQLSFAPDAQAQAAGADAHRLVVECAAVQSMQVSKAGSAKPLLKLISASASVDTTFDFSPTTNGALWRDTFKDAVATIMRSANQSAGMPAAPAGPPPSAGRGKVAEKEGSAAERRESGPVVHRLDAAAIYKYMTDYPKLMQVYRKVVPDRMSEHEFWQRFLEARTFHKDPGTEAPSGEGSADRGGACAAKVLDRMGCGLGDADASKDRGLRTAPVTRRKLTDVDEQFDLTSLDTASSIRGLSVAAEDADVERQVFHDSAAGLILYVNAHQASMLGDDGGDERGRGEDGVGKRRRVDVEDEPGANLAGQGRRLGLPVALSISRPACAPGTETPVTNTTALTRGGGKKEKGHVQRLWEWTLTPDRTMSGSSCLVRALQHISDSSAANDITPASSERDVDRSTQCPGLRGGDDGGGVGGVKMDEMARIELNLREVLRHMWQQLVSKNKDMDKLGRLEGMLGKLLQRLLDYRVLLHTQVERGLLEKQKAGVDEARLDTLLALARAPSSHCPLNSSSVTAA